jgi:hypothetical protein
MNASDWPEDNLIWFDICLGLRCSICEVPVPVKGNVAQRAFHYCSACAPGPGLPHCVLAAFDRHAEGMSLTFASLEEPEVVLWFVGLSERRVLEMVRRGRAPASQLRNLERSILQWGRGSLYTHLDDVQYANLVRAWRHDPRNGYEKKNNLPLGRGA